MKIEVFGNQVEKALTKLKQKLNQEGILKELKNRRYHEPKAMKRRRKSEEARRRNITAKRKFEKFEDNSFQTRYTRALHKYLDSLENK